MSIRFLDGSFIKQISDRNLIEGLRFSVTDSPQVGEISVPVQSDAGGRIGYFIWRPELPGNRILASVGPATAVAAIAIFFFSARSSIG